MDRGKCCAVYLDDRVEQNRWIVKDSIVSPGNKQVATLPLHESSELSESIRLLLLVLKKVYICNSGKSFAAKVAELSDASGDDFIPVFGLIDVPIRGDAESIRRHSLAQAPSQCLIPSPETQDQRNITFSFESEDLFGLHLLSRFATDIQSREVPSAIIPIAVLRNLENEPDSKAESQPKGDETSTILSQALGEETAVYFEERRICRCLDAGAVDVLTFPLKQERVDSLLIHAYRAHRDAQKEKCKFFANQKLRKQSWVGADNQNQKPYEYLREAMVSKLMKRICNPEEVLTDTPFCEVCVPDERKVEIEAAIAKWNFSAHDLSDDELTHAVFVMFNHALQMPELEHWRIPDEELRTFVLSSRAAYNSFILYHNFRHAVDVLQSTFHFLIRIGILPPFPDGAEECSTGTGLTSILSPFDALTLLVTALGHDVGHPGVNNVFLIKLNAPLAQLYNDRSVLEAFHCAAYSQILRRHWPSVFEDNRLRTLMISAILATDMGIHSRFMESLNQLRERFRTDHRKMDSWPSQDIEGYRILLCALIIKCADISNVARPFSVAERWTDILQQEFANQGEMELNIGIETALFGGPPELGNFVKKAKGQISFMDIFALPLFDGVTDILPDMAFAANGIRHNKFVWQKLIEHEGFMTSHKERGCNTPRCQSPLSTAKAYRDRLESQGTASLFYTIQHNSPSASNASSESGQFYGASDGEADGGTVTNSGDAHASISASSKTDEPQQTSTSERPTANTQPLDPAEGSDCSPTTSPLMGGRQASTNCHRTQRSSGRTSTTTTRPSDSGCARTQSTSTYTNNTLATPLSSTTQASSVVSGDSSGDDKDGAERAYGHYYGDGAPSSYESSLTDGQYHNNTFNSHHVKSLDEIPHPDNANDPSPHWYDRNQGPEKRSRFMSSILDKGFGSSHGNHNGIMLRSPHSTPAIGGRGPTSHPRTPSTSPPVSSPITPNSSTSPSASYRTLPRRRSRLRLAFWRRNKSPTPVPTTIPANATLDNP